MILMSVRDDDTEQGWIPVAQPGHARKGDELASKGVERTADVEDDSRPR
jgi:hypothetical protein